MSNTSLIPQGEQESYICCHWGISCLCGRLLPREEDLLHAMADTKRGKSLLKRGILVSDFESTVACEENFRQVFLQCFTCGKEGVSNYCKCAVNMDHKPCSLSAVWLCMSFFIPKQMGSQCVLGCSLKSVSTLDFSHFLTKPIPWTSPVLHHSWHQD